jgi:uncharacterized membrane protein
MDTVNNDTNDHNSLTRAGRAAFAHRVGLSCLAALIVLCIAWEWWLAPLRDGGSWLVLKVLPLLYPTWRIAASPARRRYTYQWTTLFIWFYFTEGAVRVYSDLSAMSRALAGIEVALCLIFFVVAIQYVRNTRRA